MRRGGPRSVERRREEESAAPSALPRQRSAELEAELGRTRWAADSAMAAVKLLEQHALPRAESEVTPFLQTIYDTFSQFKPEADTVHSKCLDVATAGGDYFGIYSLSVPKLVDEELSLGERYDYGQFKKNADGVLQADPAFGKGYVASVICNSIYGDTGWRAFEITDGKTARWPPRTATSGSATMPPPESRTMCARVPGTSTRSIPSGGQASPTHTRTP
eukprot:COSAG04_NODE_769_length_10450_cov_4.413390_4_plen_219_part_00